MLEPTHLLVVDQVGEGVDVELEPALLHPHLLYQHTDTSQREGKKMSDLATQGAEMWRYARTPHLRKLAVSRKPPLCKYIHVIYTSIHT
jgi:hypothetical protein